MEKKRNHTISIGIKEVAKKEHTHNDEFHWKRFLSAQKNKDNDIESINGNRHEIETKKKLCLFSFFMRNQYDRTMRELELMFTCECSYLDWM